MNVVEFCSVIRLCFIDQAQSSKSTRTKQYAEEEKSVIVQ